MGNIISTDPGHSYAVVGEVIESTREEIWSAVNAAHVVLSGWKVLGIEGRINFYKKLLPIYERHGEEIAHMQTLETGKTITQSRGDMRGDLALIRHSEDTRNPVWAAMAVRMVSVRLRE